MRLCYNSPPKDSFNVVLLCRGAFGGVFKCGGATCADVFWPIKGLSTRARWLHMLQSPLLHGLATWVRRRPCTRVCLYALASMHEPCAM